jgi:hypothetical protein
MGTKVVHCFHLATGDVMLRDAATTWLERGMAMRKSGEPIAAFPTRSPPQEVGRTGARGELAELTTASSPDFEPRLGSRARQRGPTVAAAGRGAHADRMAARAGADLWFGAEVERSHQLSPGILE